MKSTYQHALIALAIILGMASGERAIGATYAFTNIADNTMQASFGAPFHSFHFPSVSNGNVVSFSGRAGDTTVSGVFSGSGGALTTIAKTGDTSPLGTFTAFYLWPVSSEAGVTAFVARSTGGDGIYTGNGGPVTTIAKKGDPAPVGTFSAFDDTPQVDNGVAVFVASYDGGANEGVFTKNGGNLTTIAKKGDAPAGTVLSTFATSRIDGDVISFGANTNAIFKSQGGLITKIVAGGDAAPTGVFDAIRNPHSLSGQTVAFSADFPFVTNAGIFTGSGGPLTTIAKTGDPAPDGTFGTIMLAPSIVDDTVAFRASYTGGQRIIVSKSGQLSEVIKTGDPLFGSTVSGVQTGTFALDQSGSGSLAFLYTLANGRSGVALAQPVPEPSSCLLVVAIAGLCAAGIRTRLSASSNR